MQFDFLGVLVVLFLNWLSSFFWLWEEGKYFYLHLHLGWTSLSGLNSCLVRREEVLGNVGNGKVGWQYLLISFWKVETRDKSPHSQYSFYLISLVQADEMGDHQLCYF